MNHLVVAALVSLIFGCAKIQGSESQSANPSKIENQVPPILVKKELAGNCAVEVTQKAAGTKSSGITALAIRLSDGTRGPELTFSAGATKLAELQISKVLDLYTREHKLARLSGAVGKDSVDPVTGNRTFDAEFEMEAYFYGPGESLGHMVMKEKVADGSRPVQKASLLNCAWREVPAL
jgi:hypothetical protein